MIMSPALFKRRPLRRLKDIASHVLLSTETRPGDWAEWLDLAGLLPAAEQRRRVFDHFFVTLQAVVDGFGLGIGPLPVLQADLKSGRLPAPFPRITVPRKSYVALVPFDADKTSSLTIFIEWLIAEGTG
jgi:LysR family transcriptional regulator, glycine cleavage system transcriptional activator